MQRLLVSAALAVLAATPAIAQNSVVSGKPSVFHVTPYVGYMIFGDHFKTGNGVEFSNKNGAIFGAQAGIDMSKNLSLIGNFGYSKTNYTFENIGGPGVDINGADVGIWLYDANLQFKAPFMTPTSVFAPFVQLGVGALRFTTDDNNIQSSGSTNVAYNAGLGFDATVRGLGLRIMAKDYISSFQWDEFRNANDPNDIQDATISHNFAITAGFKIGF